MPRAKPKPAAAPAASAVSPAAPAPAAARPKGEKLAQRLSHIIALLHQGDILDKQQLAQQFGVDVRTIERDLFERLKGIAERTPEGEWRIASARRSTIPARYLSEYSQLAGAAALFPDASLPRLIGQIETRPADRGLHVQPVPEEDLRGQSRTFEQLQTAVQQHRPCQFIYKGKPRQTHPYRLIHKNGIWYLAAAELNAQTGAQKGAKTGAQQLKNFSVARIEALRVDEHAHFAPQPEHLAYLERQPDIWFTQQPEKATLRVAAAVAHYFTRRDLLPGQITRADADGSLLVTATIHHPQQLLPIVRYWMPHVRILEPQEWEEQLIHSVQETLRQWLPETRAKTRTKTRSETPSKTRAGKKAGKTAEKQTAKQAKEQP